MKQYTWCLAIALTILWGSFYYLFPALLLSWEQSHEWQRSEITFALMLAVGISAVSAPIAGRIIDRGYGPIMMASSALIGGFLLLGISFIERLWLFYLLWGLIGLCKAGCLYEPCFAFLIQNQSVNAAKMITLITLVAGFASTIYFPSIQFLLSHFTPSKTIQMLACIVIFVASPLLWFGGLGLSMRGSKSKLDQEPSAANKNKASTQKSIGLVDLIKNPIFGFLAMSFALLAMNHGIVINHLLPLLDERDLSKEYATFIISMIGPMQVSGRLLWIFAGKHLKVLTIAKICFVSIFLASCCLILSSNYSAFLFGFILLQGSAYGVLSIVKPLSIREIMGSTDFGRISGTLAVPYLLSFATAPYVGSLIWYWQDYTLLLWFILVCAAIGSISFYWVVTMNHRLTHS